MCKRARSLRVPHKLRALVHLSTAKNTGGIYGAASGGQDKYSLSWRRVLLLFLLCCLLCALSACRGVEITGKTEDVEGYSLQQTSAVLISERNRYQKALGPELWEQSPAALNGESYGTYFVERMRAFLQDVKTLNLMAREEGIAPSSTELEKLRRLSEAYDAGLSEADRAAMAGCTQKDIQLIYTEYFVACKMAAFILKDLPAELADADVKVVEVEQLVVSDRARAEQLAKDVRLEGANFSYYVRQYSESSEASRVLAKGDEQNAYCQAAFALEQDELSDIIEQDGKFYILKCLNAYDKAATQDRKKRLEAAIQLTAFRKRYHSYEEQHIVRFRDDYWKTLDLTAGTDSGVDNFFALYSEYMADKNG